MSKKLKTQKEKTQNKKKVINLKPQTQITINEVQTMAEKTITSKIVEEQIVEIPDREKKTIDFPETDPKSVSKTQQQFKEEADINNVMMKYQKTGILGNILDQRQPFHGDFTTGFEFQEAQNMIAETTQKFEALPSDLRERFGNSPAKLLDFIADPQNRIEAEKLNLIERDLTPIGDFVPAPSPVVKPETPKDEK